MMTVGDLQKLLQNLDPSLPVVITMNQEYVSQVTNDMVYVHDYGDGATLYIDDTRSL